jgi:hypothetical protein
MTLPQYGSPNFLESTFAVIPRIPRQHATKDSQGSTPTRIYLRFRQRQEVSQSKWGPEANGCSLWNLTLWPISYLGFAWSHKVTTFSIFLPLWPDIHQITRPALGLQPKDQNGALFERRQRTHTWGAQWLSGIAALKRHTPCWLGRLPWRLHGNLQDCFGSLDLWMFETSEISQLSHVFNVFGRYPLIDTEFRPYFHPKKSALKLREPSES